MVISGDAGFTDATLAGLPNPIVPGKFLQAAQADEYVRITAINNQAGDKVEIVADGAISQQIGVYEEYTDSTAGATWNADVQVRLDDNGNLVFAATPDAVGDTLLAAGANGPNTFLLSENSGEYVGIGAINDTYTDSVFGGGSYLVSPSGSLGFSSTLAGNGTIQAGVEFGGKKQAVNDNFSVNNIE